MLGLIKSIALGGLTKLFEIGGKTIVDVHTSNTARYKNEGDAGNQLAGTIVRGSTDAGAQRADVQKSQGSWGPFGIAGFIIAMVFAYYTAMIVLDSTPWHIGLTTKLWIIPWLEWREHVVGSWRVVVLPGKLEETYHAILQALFYVGPPSAALVIAAKAFRR